MHAYSSEAYVFMDRWMSLTFFQSTIATQCNAKAIEKADDGWAG